MSNKRPNNDLRNTLLMILVVGIGIVALMKLLPGLLEAFGQDPERFGERQMISVIFLIIILIGFISGFIRRGFFRRGLLSSKPTNNPENRGESPISSYFGGNAKGCLIWVMVFFVIIALYAYRHEFEDFKQRIISAVLPSYEWIGDEEISLTKYSDGHFYLNAEAISEDGKGKVARIKFLVEILLHLPQLEHEYFRVQLVLLCVQLQYQA